MQLACTSLKAENSVECTEKSNTSRNVCGFTGNKHPGHWAVCIKTSKSFY
ncbi:hypothetical protein X777_06885 [Ooceraea biroi]|uniref:Uncharacterized protein n=1 Tax=Ooceraea biroi TaxID=2015173 RepID=A0A026WDA7_OOCBI|nr:hypothetical protein X777_06885 [Ooceraea biroi]